MNQPTTIRNWKTAIVNVDVNMAEVSELSITLSADRILKVLLGLLDYQIVDIVWEALLNNDRLYNEIRKRVLERGEL